MAAKKSKTPMFTVTVAGNLPRSILESSLEDSIEYLIKARPTSKALRECRLPAASIQPVIRDYVEYFRVLGTPDINELMKMVPDAEINSFWVSVFARSPKLSEADQAGLASFLIEGLDESDHDYSLPDVFDPMLLVFMFNQRERLAKLLAKAREEFAAKSASKAQSFKADVQAQAARHGLMVSFEPVKPPTPPAAKKKAPGRHPGHPINLADAPIGVK